MQKEHERIFKTISLYKELCGSFAPNILDIARDEGRQMQFGDLTFEEELSSVMEYYVGLPKEVRKQDMEREHWDINVHSTSKQLRLATKGIQ